MDSNGLGFFVLPFPGPLLSLHNAELLYELMSPPNRMKSFPLFKGFQFHCSLTVTLPFFLFSHVSTHFFFIILVCYSNQIPNVLLKALR